MKHQKIFENKKLLRITWMLIIILLALTIIFGDKLNAETSKWKPEWDQVVQANVTAALLNQSKQQMQIYCPKWQNLNETQRRKFYADLFFGVTKFESNYNPKVIFWEKAQGRDSITKQIVVSEGLLQLSYADSPWAKCNFDYSKDKDKHLKDIANRNGKISWLSLFDKTINDPINNLKCGLKIMDYRARKNPGREFRSNMGAYWSTIRDKTMGVTAAMKTRKSECF